MFIPGRIEVLGKHTDYCGGRSIVCAIDRGFHAEIDERSDSTMVLDNVDIGEKASIDLTEPVAAVGHWSSYAAEVARRVTENLGPLNGVSIRFRSDLPKAAGLSSSSALMIMVFAALDAVNDLRSRDEFRTSIDNELQLAEYLGCVENGQTYRDLKGSAGVGTFGGSQDHAAILLGKNDLLTRFAFSPLRREADLAFPDDLTFIVASSGVLAEKTGSALEKYNRISLMVSDITQRFGTSRSLSDIASDIGFEELRNVVRKGASRFAEDELISRLRQFQFENFEAIPIVSAMIAEEKISDIGRTVNMSQQFAEEHLKNQTPETMFLQRSARELGSIAASAFGAGFGGSVYAIVRRSDADAFTDEWQNGYLKTFPQHSEASEFFVTRPSQIVLA